MTIAPSAGGRMAATWSELNPLQRDADHPDLAGAPGCSAIHAMVSAAASDCSCGRYSSSRIPSDFAPSRWSSTEMQA